VRDRKGVTVHASSKEESSEEARKEKEIVLFHMHTRVSAGGEILQPLFSGLFLTISLNFLSSLIFVDFYIILLYLRAEYALKMYSEKRLFFYSLQRRMVEWKNLNFITKESLQSYLSCLFILFALEFSTG
jgi:hypothetical protein